MGNSPEICRRHYAALIPEQMVDTVEFRKQVIPEPTGDPELKTMMRRLLEKLDGEDDKDKPKLRLIRNR